MKGHTGIVGIAEDVGGVEEDVGGVEENIIRSCM